MCIWIRSICRKCLGKDKAFHGFCLYTVFDIKCEVFFVKKYILYYERERGCKIGLLIMILIFLSHENLRTVRIFLLVFYMHVIYTSKFHGDCSLLNSNSVHFNKSKIHIYHVVRNEELKKIYFCSLITNLVVLHLFFIKQPPWNCKVCVLSYFYINGQDFYL